MSITRTKERIAEWPKSRLVRLREPSTRSLRQTNVTTDDVIALADSQTKLFDLAKRIQEHLRFGLDDNALIPIVDEAIKEAEA